MAVARTALDVARGDATVRELGTTVGFAALGLAGPGGGGAAASRAAFKPGRWLGHFQKHGERLGASNAVEYLDNANALLRGGEGVETFTRANGDQLFYREATNEFGVLSPEGNIRTYFSPDEGRDYWLREIGGER